MVKLKQYTLQAGGVTFPYIIAEIDPSTADMISNISDVSNGEVHLEDLLTKLNLISPLFQYCTGAYTTYNQNNNFDLYGANQKYADGLVTNATNMSNYSGTIKITGNLYNASNLDNYIAYDITDPAKLGNVYINNELAPRGDASNHTNAFNYAEYYGTVGNMHFASYNITIRIKHDGGAYECRTLALNYGRFSYPAFEGWYFSYFSPAQMAYDNWKNCDLGMIFGDDMGTDYNNYPDPDDPYKDTALPDGGGGGTPDWNSDPITERALPANFYGQCGLVSVFTPTTSELTAFSSYLWGGSFDLSSFKKIVNNPFDLILGLNYIPFKTITAGARSINVGNITNTGLTMSYPSQENYKHDFGSLSVNEQYKNFSDYAPHTRMKIHLPFIGTQEIDPDLIRRGDFNDTTIKLTYKYNIVNGTVCAYLMTANDKLLYQWSGNALTPIPIASNDYTNMYKALANMASSAVSGAVSGGVVGSALGGVGALAGAGAGAVMGAMQGGVDTMASLKPTITTTGGIGASGAILNATNDAYLIIEQPQLIVPNRFRHYSGLPRSIIGTIEDNLGYNEILSCRMGITNATEQEKIEIENILKTGYIYGDPDEGIIHTPSTPSGNDLKLALYQTNTSNTRIDKSVGHLHTYTDIVLKDNTSIVNPTIKLRASDVNVLKGNYCYIPKFKRFYYITDIRNLGGWYFDEQQQLDMYLWELDLKCDVLMSFRKQIIKHSVIFKKSESNWNLYLNDSNIQIDNRTRTIIKKFPNSLTNDATYVLLLAGA